MTKKSAAIALLSLGPLSFSEFAEITGWPRPVCSRVLGYLSECGYAALYGPKWRLSGDCQ